MWKQTSVSAMKWIEATTLWKADLKNLSVPKLAIGSRYDTMDPEAMKWMSEEVQNGTYLYCPQGSHMSMYDDQKVYFDGLIQFIKGID